MGARKLEETKKRQFVQKASKKRTLCRRIHEREGSEGDQKEPVGGVRYVGNGQVVRLPAPPLYTSLCIISSKPPDVVAF
eukprot:2620102-Pleurochrysis_carterae.AAC.1